MKFGACAFCGGFCVAVFSLSWSKPWESLEFVEKSREILGKSSANLLEMLGVATPKAISGATFKAGAISRAIKKAN